MTEQQMREILAEETHKLCKPSGEITSCYWPRCGCDTNESACYAAMSRISSTARDEALEEAATIAESFATICLKQDNRTPSVYDMGIGGERVGQLIRLSKSQHQRTTDVGPTEPGSYAK